MSFVKTVFRHGVVYAIPAFISRSLSLFLVPLYTRVLAPSDYGALDLLLAFGNFINLTIALEISQGLARLYFDAPDADKKTAYSSSAFWFTGVNYTAFLLITLLFAPSLSKLLLGVPGLDNIFRLAMCYIWLNGIFGLAQSQLRWELRSRQFATISLLVTLVTPAASFICIFIFKLKLAGILCGLIAGMIGGLIYGLWNLRGTFRFRFDRVATREMLAYSMPLVPSSISVFVNYYIDRLMIRHYLSLTDVGIYGIGFRLASVTGLLMIGFNGALTPLIYSHYREAETPRQLATLFRIFAAFALVVFLGLSLFAKDILWVMTTPAYYSAAYVVIYLVPSILFAGMYIFAPGIDIEKKTSIILWINAVGALINVLLNYLLVPLFGISGAAIATLTGSIAVFVSYMVASQRLYPVPHHWPTMIWAATLTLIVAVFGLHLGYGTFTLLAVKGSMAIVMVILFLPIGLIKKSEMRQVFHLATNKFPRA